MKAREHHTEQPTTDHGQVKGLVYRDCIGQRIGDRGDRDASKEKLLQAIEPVKLAKAELMGKFSR